MQTQDTNTLNGIPGLTNIPILGRFFLSSNTKDRSRGELLIALIPHIVRTPDIEALDVRGVAAGTDQTVKLSFAPRKEETPPAPPTPPAPAAPAPAAPAAPAAPSAAPAPSAPAGEPKLSFSPSPVQVALSAPLIVDSRSANRIKSHRSAI